VIGKAAFKSNNARPIRKQEKSAKPLPVCQIRNCVADS